VHHAILLRADGRSEISFEDDDDTLVDEPVTSRHPCRRCTAGY
jgi:putative NADH-flavin reductase